MKTLQLGAMATHSSQHGTSGVAGIGLGGVRHLSHDVRLLVGSAVHEFHSRSSQAPPEFMTAGDWSV